MTKVYIDASDGMRALGEVAVWAFDLDIWGECTQATTEDLALEAFATRTGRSGLSVVEEITGADQVFARDLLPATDAERERTLEILAQQRLQTVALLRSASPGELRREDKRVSQPIWMDWRTPESIAFHIASTESRSYPQRLGLPARDPLPEMFDELEASGQFVRDQITRVAPDQRHRYKGEVWTTVKFLRRLAWHERLETVYLKRRLSS